MELVVLLLVIYGFFVKVSTEGTTGLPPTLSSIEVQVRSLPGFGDLKKYLDQCRRGEITNDLPSNFQEESQSLATEWPEVHGTDGTLTETHPLFNEAGPSSGSHDTLCCSALSHAQP
ncbi:hypothetical protein QAD02_005945, partial [Eretmocerus hayati]